MQQDIISYFMPQYAVMIKIRDIQPAKRVTIGLLCAIARLPSRPHCRLFAAVDCCNSLSGEFSRSAVWLEYHLLAQEMSGLYILVLCLAIYPLTCLGDSQGVCGDSISPGPNDTK